MDTQEKEKKSEEIAAQTNQTKERPFPRSLQMQSQRKKRQKSKLN